jgi:type IV pilus assembly protein PilB
MDVSTFTLEDPIEFRMPLVRQTQVKDEVGLTFSAGLRALLRQDPDIILVGETRDTETAQLMVRAALTGHLVFSTLHTNDAPGSIRVWWTWAWNRICCRPVCWVCWVSAWSGPCAGNAARK